MTKTRKHLISLSTIVVVFLFPISSLFAAGDTLQISLEDAFIIATEQAPSMITARYDSIAAAGNWRASRGGWFPQISMSHDIPSFYESIQEQFVWDPDLEKETISQVPSGDLRWQSSLRIDQDLPWGATLNLTSRLYKREWYWTLLDEKEEFTEYSYLNRATLNQPLLAGNPVRRNQKIDKIDYNTSLLEYTENLRELRYLITQRFYRLVSAEMSLEIARSSLISGQSSAELAERKLKSGLIPEVELLQIQVDVARRENSYQQSKASLEAAREQLKLALGIDLDTPVTAVYDINLMETEQEAVPEINGEFLDIIRQSLILEKTELQTNASIWSERIQASLQAFYEIDSREEELKNIDNFGERNIGVTLHVEFPVYGFGTTSGRIQALRASKRKAQTNLQASYKRLEADLRRAVREVELARDQITISSAAVNLSEKSLSITEERFENGLIDSRDLLDSQLELSTVKRDALNAIIDYKLAVAYLDRIAPISNLEDITQ